MAGFDYQVYNQIRGFTIKLVKTANWDGAIGG
jgi:hypothetical protein